MQRTEEQKIADARRVLQMLAEDDVVAYEEAERSFTLTVVTLLLGNKYETTQDVPVRLTGTDGNVFAIIGTVAKAMRRAGFSAEAKAFEEAAFSSESYDAVLVLAFQTVDVS